MKFYGQWNPPVDEVLYRNFFPDGYPRGTLVECGAGDGVTESCGLFFEERGWFAVNIEPDEARFKQLETNRPKAANSRLALSDKVSKDVFNRGPLPDQSVKSTCWTWKHFVEHYDLSNIDLFVLDVEGHELPVVRGMVDCPVLPKVMCVEYTWPSTGLSRLNLALADLGYYLLFLSFNNAFFGREKRIGPFFGETKHWGE